MDINSYMFIGNEGSKLNIICILNHTAGTTELSIKEKLDLITKHMSRKRKLQPTALR